MKIRKRLIVSVIIVSLIMMMLDSLLLIPKIILNLSKGSWSQLALTSLIFFLFILTIVLLIRSYLQLNKGKKVTSTAFALGFLALTTVTFIDEALNYETLPIGFAYVQIIVLLIFFASIEDGKKLW
ncbi:hypothetical protein [Streptococcus sobrinus]|uniref:hypothetical protein n=1 Tax=Streptococcus sobrinus TaxID=1310 RepID=UPI0003748DB5|nr:hypothetical protein [Streptococcus sobrinus]